MNIIQFLCFLCLVSIVSAWNKWDYNVIWDPDPEEAINRELQWRTIWEDAETVPKHSERQTLPRPRRGHSLHLIHTDERSIYGGATYIVLFGGRSNDDKVLHVPRTYDIHSVNGTLEFTTYDEKSVNPCHDIENRFYTIEDQVNCFFYTGYPNATEGLTLEDVATINIGVIYNDVWAYKLCNSTKGERGFDTACDNSGWELWHPGDLQGGCVIQLGIEVCSVPSERYNHGSSMFDDGTLYVYGGFSQRCEDYCDDIWFFDIYKKSWRQVYKEKKLTNFYTDVKDDIEFDVNPEDVPVSEGVSRFAGPSKRWRHTISTSKSYTDTDGLIKQKMYIFGGHRLWHGFSPENSQENNWSSYITRPHGGYLNDLWVYTKELDFSFPGENYKKSYGTWKLYKPIEECEPNPGLDWDSRFDEKCKTVVPTVRASHGASYDDERDRLWIFGGFSTYYPYLSTSGLGSGWGMNTIGSGGFIPYPGFKYFKNDLWYFDFKTNLWKEVIPEHDSPIPDPRMDPVFLLLGEIIFLHGGFSDNFIYGDTWYYNITSNRWLEKTDFVRPIYPEDCTDDIEYIETHECIHLQWPLDLEREINEPFNPLEYADQPYRWPYESGSKSLYFETLKKGSFDYLDPETINDLGPNKDPGIDTVLTPGLFNITSDYPTLSPTAIAFEPTQSPTLSPTAIPSYAPSLPPAILNRRLYESESSLYNSTVYLYNPSLDPMLKKFVPPEIFKELQSSSSFYFEPGGGSVSSFTAMATAPTFAPTFVPTFAPTFSPTFAPTYGDISHINSQSLELLLSLTIPSNGTGAFPYMANGPWQFVEKRTFVYNSTHNFTLFQHCTSVFSDPLRNLNLPLVSNKKLDSIIIPQPRRQRPGWDGCRDRADKRLDLVKKLQYVQPLPRYSHRAIFVPEYDEIFVYGGMSYIKEESMSLNYTYESVVQDDLWYYNLHHCVNNCSSNGNCYYGFCYCFQGFYGVDCSNTSCPGTSCYYDPITHKQNCMHGCQAGFSHVTYATALEYTGSSETAWGWAVSLAQGVQTTFLGQGFSWESSGLNSLFANNRGLGIALINSTSLEDIAYAPPYLSNIAKVPCSEEFQGESTGICDGFGKSICSPPFVGDDCSIRDCLNNCNNRGYCALEYPIGRCLCHPGYYGPSCEFQVCLNNCSYPNGNCNITSGECQCNMMYSPYNNTREFQPWGGEDCSYLFPYSGVKDRLSKFSFLTHIITILSVSFLLFLF